MCMYEQPEVQLLTHNVAEEKADIITHADCAGCVIRQQHMVRSFPSGAVPEKPGYADINVFEYSPVP